MSLQRLARRCCQDSNKVQILQQLEAFTTRKACHKITNALDVALARWEAASCLCNCFLQILLASRLQLVGVSNCHHYLQFSCRLHNGMIASDVVGM